MKLRPQKTILFALILSLGLVLTDRALADGQFHFIVGYVRDTAGNPVVGLDVIGDDYVGDYLNSWPTDTNGFYKIDAQTDGNYRVTPSCARLTALGFRCVAPVAVSVSAEITDLNFVVEPGASPVQVTNTSLPTGNMGSAYSAQLGATGGQSPYRWQLAVDSTGLPPGLSLTATGLIFGTPTTNTQSNIKVQVTDLYFNVASKIIPITINPKPVLSAPVWQANQFSMWLTGASNQNYTIQMSANLGPPNWTSLFVTNNPAANAFVVTDPTATNSSRFYRVLVGP